MIFKQVRKVVLQVIVTTWIYGLIYYHISDANFWIKGKLSSTPKLFYWEKNLEVWNYELPDLTQLLG